MITSIDLKSFGIGFLVVVSVILGLISCNNTAETTAVGYETGADTTEIEAGTVSGIIIPWSLDQVIEGSDVIISGTVSGILPSEEGPLTKDPERIYIYTDIIVKIEKCLMGTISFDNIAVRVPGGQIDDQPLISSYDIKFEVGEQVVLYLVEFSTGKSPEGMSMDAVYKLAATQGKAIIQGDTVFNTDKDETVLSVQELTEKIKLLNK